MTAATSAVGPSDPAPRANPACPHCKGQRVIRWGRLGLRPRYRCRNCRRTFNSFTGTPLAYLKRTDGWAAFRECMEACLTVRATASRVGVHRDTAFRWRHRLLDAIGAGESPVLGGYVAVGETTFLYSEKGKRPLLRSARRHGSPHRWNAVPRVRVLLAIDDDARSLHEVVGLRRCTANDVRRILAPALTDDTVLLAREGPLGAVGIFARGARLGYRRLPRLPRVDPARATHATSVNARRAIGEVRSLRDRAREIDACADRLKRWIRPFRGVATRYLPNYLVWHRALARTAAALAS